MRWLAVVCLLVAIRALGQPATSSDPHLLVDWLRDEQGPPTLLSWPSALTSLLDGSIAVLSGNVATRLDGVDGSVLSRVAGRGPVSPEGFSFSISSVGGSLSKVDLRSGRSMWADVRISPSYPGRQAERSLVFARPGTLVVAETPLPLPARTPANPEVGYETRLFALDSITGRQLWGPFVLPLDAAASQGGILADARGDILVVSDHAVVTKVDVRSGSIAWQTRISEDPFTWPPRFRSVLNRNGDLVLLRTEKDTGRYRLFLLASASGSTSEFGLYEGAFGGISEHRLVGVDAAGHALVLSEGSPGTLELTSHDLSGRGVVFRTRRSGSSRGPILHHSSVVISATGDVALGIVRSPWPREGPYTLTLERFDGGTGTCVWTARREGSLEGPPIGPVLTFTPEGDVVMAYREGRVVHRDAVVVVERLGGGTGAGLWRTSVRNDMAPGWSRHLSADVGMGILTASDFYDAGREVHVWQVSRLDALSGEVVWRSEPLPLGQGIERDPEGNVLVRSATSGPATEMLQKLQVATGHLVWSAQLEGRSLVQIAPDGDIVVATSADGPSPGLSRLAADTGRVRWKVPLEAPIRLIAVDGDAIFLVRRQAAGGSSVDHALERRDLATGARILAVALDFWPASLLPAPGGGVYLVRLSPYPSVLRLDASTGAVVWTASDLALGAFDAALVDGAGDLLLASRTITGWPGWYPPSNLAVQKLSGVTGERVWRTPPSQDTGIWGPIPIALLASGDVVIPRLRLDTTSGEESVRITVLDGATGAPLLESDELPLDASDVQVEAIADRVFLAAGHAAGVTIASFSTRLGLRGHREGSTLAMGAARCGEPYGSTLSPVNAAPPFEVALGSGELPPGLALDESTGEVQGTPVATGAFSFQVRLSDARGSTMFVDAVLDVVPSAPALAIEAERVSPPCAPLLLRLHAPEASGAITWHPSGERTASILVSPVERTAYGITSMDETGCSRSGYVLVEASRLSDTTAPAVVPPSPIVVRQTTCSAGAPGVSISTSPPLAGFLSGGEASDDCGFVERLAPLVPYGAPVDDAFVPAGETEVSFRFRDAAGNTGSSSSYVEVRAIGDLDLDADVDVFDAVILMSALVGDLAPGVAPFRADSVDADTTRDGTLDVRDLVLLMGHVAGNAGCLTP